MDRQIGERIKTAILLLPFIAVFLLLILEELFEDITYIINILIISFVAIISLVLFIIAMLAYFKTKKHKFFQIMIAFFFFLLNSLILVWGLISNVSPLKIETLSNLFFLGALIWLLLPILKKNVH